MAIVETVLYLLLGIGIALSVKGPVPTTNGGAPNCGYNQPICDK